MKAKEEYLIVKRARNGKGIFTTRTVKKNAVLFELKGKVVPYMRLWEEGGAYQDNAFRYGPETYLSPAGYLGDFLNHSCEPSAKMEKVNRRLYVRAIQPIKSGQEVTIDYATTLATDDIWRMHCNCGSKQCRKIIRNYTYLPVLVLENYKKRALIPAHILRI
jgi:hypothetical protein